jgi:hypothetical protein
MAVGSGLSEVADDVPTDGVQLIGIRKKWMAIGLLSVGAEGRQGR